MKAHLLLALGLALGLACAVFLAVPAPASQAQITCQRYVTIEGADAGDCSEAGTPCQTVQYAIDQSADGDRICVAALAVLPDPTVYKETITIDRSVILDGKWESQCFVHIPCGFWPVEPCDPNRVVLDAQGNGRVITIEPKTAPTIDCFTITGGDADKLWGDPGDDMQDPGDDNHAGGGIYGDYASPIIVNNIISGNFGCDTCTAAYGRGGGIYLLYAGGGTIIRGNLISHNVADNSTWGEGGGIMLRESHGTVEGNLISYNRAGNSAGYGGGIAVVDGRPVITGNAVSWNVAGQAVMGIGGGIWVWSDETVVIENNSIYSNRAISGEGDPALASYGGGIYYGGHPTVVAAISGNMILDNAASLLRPQLGLGGGLYVTGTVTPTLIAGNTFEANYAGFNGDGNGGGLYVEGSEATIADNQIAGNYASWAGSIGQGGGLFVDGSAVTLRGNDVISNTCGGFPGPPAATMGYGGGMVISGTVALVEDNTIAGNRATNSPGVALGGGIYVYTSTVRIRGNAISENSTNHGTYQGPSGFGGGLYVEDSLLTLDGNAITDNQANAATQGGGGGLSLSFCPAFTVTNNIIARNSASQWASGVAVGNGSAGRLAHNTIADNIGGDGSGVRAYADSEATLYGNIIRRHQVGILNDNSPVYPDSTVTADYTLFEDNTDDYTPNVTSTFEILPPALLLPDYHLALGSNAIDQVPPLDWVTRDIDRQRRPLWAASDAGADEHAVAIYLPVILRQ